MLQINICCQETVINFEFFRWCNAVDREYTFSVFLIFVYLQKVLSKGLPFFDTLFSHYKSIWFTHAVHVKFAY